MGPTGVITEQGDLGLGYTPLSESERAEISYDTSEETEEYVEDN